ncbi:hypothetical protein SAMN05518672_10327 [Chitinophaga sp. CF118]|uniref:hypothetical protein n=1 Tax=Chitinophaga sp. CF118 TaxID=1884367 RepID=UPI0008E30BF7|nr:hypothetical protein [Chitinophaga sp. CF118]SFD74253.1 hypothetical protein SAMN05518672_10327 [Chitinophaga sp. CF118]
MIFKTHYASLFLICIILPSCYSPKIPLSKEEENFGNVLAERYHCEVNLEHDYKAITENRKDGTFWIELKNSHTDLCSKDSIALKNMTSEIAKKIHPLLTHKLNYNSIEVVFRKSEHPDKKTESLLCDKHLKINTATFDSIQVIY